MLNSCFNSFNLIKFTCVLQLLKPADTCTQCEHNLSWTGSPPEIPKSLHWSFRDQWTENPDCRSTQLYSSPWANLSVIPWIGLGKPKHSEAFENAPDHLKNNLWRKYPTRQLLFWFIYLWACNESPQVSSLPLWCGDLEWISHM